MRFPVLLLAACCASAAFAAESDDLLQLEAKRSAAILAKDKATLDAIYADDFRSIAGNGTIIDKTTLMDVLANNDPNVVFAVDELNPRLFGETAVVTGRLTARDKAGAIRSQSRFTHVYVKRGGAWKLVAAQATPVAQPN